MDRGGVERLWQSVVLRPSRYEAKSCCKHPVKGYSLTSNKEDAVAPRLLPLLFFVAQKELGKGRFAVFFEPHQGLGCGIRGPHPGQGYGCPRYWCQCSQRNCYCQSH